jgi:site-specific DNA recombinase
LDYLLERCRLERWEVFGEYVDDGVKRTTPLAQRPGGRRFLVDARGGKFDTVLAMRLDRLARSLRVLLDANTALAVFCVSIKSAQEPSTRGTHSAIAYSSSWAACPNLN